MSIYKRGRIWWIKYYDKGKLIQRSLDTEDELEAQEEDLRIKKTKRRKGNRRASLINETAFLSLDDLLEMYEKDMRRERLSSQHIGQKRRQLEGLFSEARASTVRGLTEETITGALSELSHLAPRTQNDYRAATHKFFVWLLKKRRWDRNPVENIPVVVEDDDPRRRPLRPEELRSLLGVSPPHRRLVYLVAANTGLRRGELRSLSCEAGWQRVDLDAKLITVPSSLSKNRKWVQQPIPSSTVEEWRNWLLNPLADVPGRSPRIQRCLAPLPPIPTKRTFARDAAKAGIELVSARGDVVFHSLRGTYITGLFRAGVSPAQVQTLARHADISTTLKYYTRFDLCDAQAAVEGLNEVFDVSRREEDGTDKDGSRVSAA